MQPNEQTSVSYKVNVPKSVPDGGQYAAIFAETNEKADKSSIMRKKRVGIILYGQPQGNTNESGEVKLAKLSNIQVVSKLEFVQKLINKGNTDAVANINIKATSLGGKELFSVKRQKPTLPETTRSVPFKWENTPSLGLVNLSQEVNYAGKQNTSKQTILIISPTMLAIISFILVLVIGVIIYTVRKSKKHTKIHSRR